MAGLRVTTEESLVKEQEQNMFYFTRKNTRISHGLYDHKTHCAILPVNNIEHGATALTTD
jgi:hypothetical protein